MNGREGVTGISSLATLEQLVDAESGVDAMEDNEKEDVRRGVTGGRFGTGRRQKRFPSR